MTPESDIKLQTRCPKGLGSTIEVDNASLANLTATRLKAIVLIQENCLGCFKDERCPVFMLFNSTDEQIKAEFERIKRSSQNMLPGDER